MNVAIILLCLALSATLHQGLYLIIPLLSLFHISTGQKSTLKLNPILKLYLGVVVAVVLFFVVQSVYDLRIGVFSLKGIARYVSYFLFAVMVFSFKSNTINQIFKILIVYFVITIPLGLYQVWSIDRYQNIFRHANHLAYVLDICIYYLIFYKPFNKKPRLVCLILLFVSLLLTKSSGGIMVLMALLGYNVVISKRISFRRKLILFFSSLTIGVIAIVYSEKLSSQIQSLSYLNWDFLEDRVEDFRAGGYGSFIWRIIYWIKIIFSFLSESTFQLIFGVGVDHLTEGNMPYDFMRKDPHNDFIKILVEFGFFGLFLFLGLFWKLYRIMNKNLNIIILILVPMFFGNVIVNFPYNLGFILLLAYEYKRNTCNLH